MGIIAVAQPWNSEACEQHGTVSLESSPRKEIIDPLPEAEIPRRGRQILRMDPMIPNRAGGRNVL